MALFSGIDDNNNIKRGKEDMAMIVVETQYMENYGTADNAHWKAKGGSSYKILNVPLNQDLDAVVSAANIGYKNDFAEEYVIGWTVQADDFLSMFERDQLEYEGKIVFAEPTIEYAELVKE